MQLPTNLCQPRCDALRDLLPPDLLSGLQVCLSHRLGNLHLRAQHDARPRCCPRRRERNTFQWISRAVLRRLGAASHCCRAAVDACGRYIALPRCRVSGARGRGRRNRVCGHIFPRGGATAGRQERTCIGVFRILPFVCWGK